MTVIEGKKIKIKRFTIKKVKFITIIIYSVKN